MKKILEKIYGKGKKELEDYDYSSADNSLI